MFWKRPYDISKIGNISHRNLTLWTERRFSHYGISTTPTSEQLLLFIRIFMTRKIAFDSKLFQKNVSLFSQHFKITLKIEGFLRNVSALKKTVIFSFRDQIQKILALAQIRWRILSRLGLRRHERQAITTNFEGIVYIVVSDIKRNRKHTIPIFRKKCSNWKINKNNLTGSVSSLQKEASNRKNYMIYKISFCTDGKGKLKIIWDNARSRLDNRENIHQIVTKWATIVTMLDFPSVSGSLGEM